MNISKLCMGCMREYDEEGICPHCGYKRGTPNSSRGLQPQTILNGKYLVGKVIGEGGFGITYIAYDLILNSRVAIKEYFPSELVTRDTSTGIQTSITVITESREEEYKKGIERFVREAGNLAKFNNLSGIVSVKEFFYENNTAYMVMEYIDGVTLSEYLNNNGGKIDYMSAIEMLSPVMDSLEKIHNAGIIHRDISPDNIMVTKDGEMKLIDFGAARIIDNNDAKSLTVILKHGYAPEEQYQSNGNQGTWTDVYALAATMYRMITGEVPQESTDRVLSGDKVEAIYKLNPEVPRSISNAIMHGISVKASKRTKTISKLKMELQNGRRNRQALLFEISAVAIVSVILIATGIMGIYRQKERGKEKVNTEDRVTNSGASMLTNEGKDNSLIETESIKLEEKTEEELSSMIEEKSGMKITYGIYEDYDGDGSNEYYCFVSTSPDNTEYATDSSGQIWFANAEGAQFVYDTKDSSNYGYWWDNYNCGLLSFANCKNFFMTGEADNYVGSQEIIAFAYYDSVPKLIYQGKDKIYSENGKTYLGVYQHDESFYSESFDTLEYMMDYEIICLNGKYYEYGLNPMSESAFWELINAQEAYNEALSSLNQEKASLWWQFSIGTDFECKYSEYPYKEINNIYSCGNEHIYIDISCYKDKEHIVNYVGDVPRKIDASLSFKINGNIVSYDGFSTGKRIKQAIGYTEQDNEGHHFSIYYKPADLLYKKPEEKDSEKSLIDSVVDYYNPANQEYEYEYEYEDFNGDGSKEMFCCIYAYIDELSDDISGISPCDIGIYYADKNGILTLYRAVDYTSSLASSFTNQFGKNKICAFDFSTSYFEATSDTKIFGVIGDGIVEYNLISNSQFGKAKNGDISIESTDEGVFIKLWPDVHKNYEGKPYVEFTSRSANIMETQEEVKLWYVNGEFLECASINIDKNMIKGYEGGTEILDSIATYIQKYLNSLSTNSYWSGRNSGDYDIDSVMYCSDGHFYINCIPVSNLELYSSSDRLLTVVIQLNISDNELSVDDVYYGYRESIVTGLNPYYPQLK